MKKSIILILFLKTFHLFAQLNPEFIQMRPQFTRLVNFSYTGSIQSWVVPQDVFTIFINAKGAQGGDNPSFYIGGRGGMVTAILKVTPGDILHIVVGGQSTNETPAYGFGGAGGLLTAFPARGGKAGGGLTGIFTSSTITQANALIIAAGGGGATSYPNATYTDYGAGGGLTGRNGFNNFQFSYGQIWGLGGTQTTGGARGIPSDPNYILPTAGSALQGGSGGHSNAAASSGWLGGGGGGAGYFGGGGGCAGGNAQGSGGGGSSFAISSAINVVHTENNNTGHGSLQIRY